MIPDPAGNRCTRQRRTWSTMQVYYPFKPMTYNWLIWRFDAMVKTSSPWTDAQLAARCLFHAQFFSAGDRKVGFAGLVFGAIEKQSLRVIFTVRLHVMQRTVLLSKFCPSVCPSVRPSGRCVYCDKTKRCTANILIPHEKAITLVFWHWHWLVGDAPFPLKSTLKLTRPSEKRRLRHISAYNVSTVRDSEKSSIITNIKSTMGFPTSYRCSAYVTSKSIKDWLKKRFFVFFSKSQRLIVSGAVNLVRRWVSLTSDGRRQCWSHPPSRSVFSS